MVVYFFTLPQRSPARGVWQKSDEKSDSSTSLGNPKGGLAKGGLAQKAPIGPKKAFSGEFLLAPRGCEVRRNRSLKRLQSAPKRPDFPGRIFARFSLKIWGLSPPFVSPRLDFPKSGKVTEKWPKRKKRDGTPLPHSFCGP